MKHKFDFVKVDLEKIKSRHLYRKLQDGTVEGSHIIIKRKKLINLCSNDYLGLCVFPAVKKQLQSSSRLVSGNDFSFRFLEEELAEHKSQESSLIFPTGYMANLGSLPTLAHKEDLILSDELNHASIIESCRLSGAKIAVYRHNDVEDIEKKIKTKSKNKFIVTEGIFSMDGDFAKLREISTVATKNNAILVLDDAHGDFVVGSDGKGTAHYFGVENKIDVYVSSLSKGLGSFGGYIASQKKVVDLMVNKAKPFIYTSALPNFLVCFAHERFVSNREKNRKKLWKNIKFMHKGLKSLGFETNLASQIIPIMVGSEKTAMEFGKFLFDNGIFAQPIRYPTVKLNQARIRISITAWLTKDHIDRSLDVFEMAGKKFKII